MPAPKKKYPKTVHDVQVALKYLKDRQLTPEQREQRWAWAKEKRAKKAAEKRESRLKDPVRPKMRHEPLAELPMLKVPPVMLAILEIERLKRNVSRATLHRDILLLWMRTIVDTRQAIYVETLPKNGRDLPEPVERHPGYLRGIGYAESIPAEVPPDTEEVVLPEPPSQPSVDEPKAETKPLPPHRWLNPIYKEDLLTRVNEAFRPPDIQPIDEEERDFLAGFGGSGVGKFKKPGEE